MAAKRFRPLAHLRGLVLFWVCFLVGFCLVCIAGMGGSPAVLFVPGLFFLLSNIFGLLYLAFLGLRFLLT